MDRNADERLSSGDAYVAAMHRMADGDMAGARADLQAVLGGMAAEDPWRLPALRGLAQIELATGELESARWLLDQLVIDASPTGFAATCVLWGRLLVRTGEPKLAADHLATAEAALADPGEGPGMWLTAASLLAAAAELWLRLGQVAAAASALRQGAAALLAAGLQQVPVGAQLAVFGASAARLGGDAAKARSLLDRIEPHVAALESRELVPVIQRERARLAFDAGERAEAARLWREAVAGFRGLGYAVDAEETESELEAGPPRPAAPLEGRVRHAGELLVLRMGEAPAPSAGIQIVVPLAGGEHGSEEERTALLGWTEELSAALPGEVGEVDGWEVGGGEWRIFCYGPDAQALLAALAPVAASTAPAGARVLLTGPGGEREVPIDRPPPGAKGESGG